MGIDIRAIYSEDNDICSKCCLFNICGIDGRCPCDRYREENRPDVNGGFYFVIDSSDNSGEYFHFSD